MRFVARVGRTLGPLVALALTGCAGEHDSREGVPAATSGGALFDAPSVATCVDAADVPQRDAAPPCVVPSPPTTFSRDVAPLLARCGGETCHDSTWAGPRPWESLVRRPARGCCGRDVLVAPFDPSASYLVRKLRGVDVCAGGRMPEGAPPLDEESIDAIAGWICAGAPDD